MGRSFFFVSRGVGVGDVYMETGNKLTMFQNSGDRDLRLVLNPRVIVPQCSVELKCHYVKYQFFFFSIFAI